MNNFSFFFFPECHTHAHRCVAQEERAQQEVCDAGNPGMFSAHIKQQRSGVMD